jgi:hypothetical protein
MEPKVTIMNILVLPSIIPLDILQDSINYTEVFEILSAETLISHKTESHKQMLILI